MQLFRYQGFDASVNALWKKGGQFQKAAEKIQAAIGRYEQGGDPLTGLGPTEHGEPRISGCVKYHLTGYARLVTVETSGWCVFVFCGDHEDCQRWLDRNKGFKPVLDADNRVTATYVTSDGTQVSGPMGHSVGPLYQQLSDETFDGLVSGVPRPIVRTLEQIDSSIGIAELWASVAEIANDERRIAIHDVFALLRQDKRREAVERANIFFGNVMPLAAVSEDELPDVVDSDVIRRIDATSSTYSEALKRFMASAQYNEWMLFMHPEQEAAVEEDFSGPAKLVGVSGSGKTCVVVKRAVRLAREYPTEHILVLTINRALAALIAQLVAACANPDELARISVKPFFSLCRELLLEFEPRASKSYEEITWKNNEHIDEIWQEYYRCEVNNHDASVLQPLHDSLLSRGWNPERYLREEADWLRSALYGPERAKYLEITRVGRTVPLLPHFRQAVLEGTQGWEEKMAVVGAIDGLGIAQALSAHRDRLTPRWRCVLVDEAQDFGNLELDIVRRLVTRGENDLFLCGDAAQAVTTKYQSLKAIDVDIPGSRSRKLLLNYRNSRDVLTAAHAVLLENLTEEMIDREDFEILDPEFSTFTAATPLLLEGNGLEDELAHAVAFVEDALSRRADAKACIAICGYTLYELTKFGSSARLPVLDGKTDIGDGAIFLSDLEQTKGFEFDVVCVLNCSAGVLPNSAAPESERYRDLARLYVAMTRATTDLVLSWSGVRSPFLEGADSHFLSARWPSYASEVPVRRLGSPQRLRTQFHGMTWAEMTGEQFLYSDFALGTSIELITKIRDLIDGRGLKKERQRIRWRTLGTAAADYEAHSHARRLWGQDAPEFAALISRLETQSATQ